jgi:DNA-binding NarL/FixJ family response regulator
MTARLFGGNMHALTNSSMPRTRLTRREWEVAAMVATARSNREIASELYVNTKTIEFHIANLFTKLGVRNRTALATWWLGQQHEGLPGRTGRSPLVPGTPGA